MIMKNASAHGLQMVDGIAMHAIDKAMYEIRERQLQMCIWFAEMRSPQQVANLVSVAYPEIGKYSRQAAYKFSKSKKWSRIIRFLRKKIFSNIAYIPITHKAIRLRRLEEIYQKAMTPVLKSHTKYGKIYVKNLTAALSALEEARNEVEGGSKGNIATDEVGISIINELHKAAIEHNSHNLLLEQQNCGSDDKAIPI